MQRTLCLVKPDAVYRRLIGQIVTRFEQKGLRIDGMKMLRLDEQAAGELYRVHRGKEFYEPLVRFIGSGPVVALALAGPDAIEAVRHLVGDTFGRDAVPGSLRGDFALSRRQNVVHASDGPQAAERELSLLFGPGELLEYDLAAGGWIAQRRE
jgi:nucleoside-diphosphate kinase